MSKNVFRIVGIDPGSKCFGLSVIDYDMEEDTINLVHAETFKSEPLLSDNHPYMILGARGARHMLCEDYVLDRLNEYKPHLVCCESAFLKFKAVNAYKSLIEGIVTIRRAVFRYDETLHLLLVDPPSAKKAVGAPGKGGDKESVRKGIRKLKELIKHIDIERLDEHSIDSIAMGYWAMLKWLGEMRVLFQK